jgi:hypothetical protein
MLRTLFLGGLLLSGSIAWGCTGVVDDGGPAAGPRVPDPRDPTRTLPAFEPPSGGLRRLTTVQYENSVADLLGLELAIAEEIERDPTAEDEFRFSDVLATSVTSSLLAVEKYDAAARLAAATAFADPARRDALVGCAPATSADPCVSAFLRSFLRRAFRRPADAAEVAEYAGVVATGERALGTVAKGLEYAVATALQAPSFLYRVEVGAPGPDGTRTLDGYEMATRLSYFFWDTTPDAALLDAAERGDLATSEGLAREATRLAEAERAKPAMQRFFDEWFGIRALDQVPKSETTYPAFDRRLAASMRGEIERLTADAIHGADVLGLFTTSESWVDGTLARFYGIDLGAGGETTIERYEAERESDGDCADFPGFFNVCSESEVAHEFDLPAGGTYVLRARVYGAQAGPETVRAAIAFDGTVVSMHEVTAGADAPETIEIEIAATAGLHSFGVRFLNDYYMPPENRDLRVDWLEVVALGEASADFARTTLPPERRGILSLGWFPTLYAQPIDTSPTQRGLFIRNRLLCEHIPPPPPGVVTTLPPASATVRTNRERVARHMSDATCSTCHARMDPLGLPLEHFDGIGQYRETQDGIELDVTGDLDGTAFDGAIELGEVLAADQRTVDCVVRQVYRHGLGLDEAAEQEIAIAELSDAFRASGHSLRALAIAFATSDAFRRTGEPR